MRLHLALSIVIAVAACNHREPAPPTRASSEAAPAPKAEETSLPGSKDLAPLVELLPQLRAEATHRPAAKVSSDRLFAALVAAGVELKTQKQVLATTAAAAYCALGVTPENLAIAVCEYPSSETARAGLALLDQRYRKLVPDAVRKINGSTLVTVANGASHQALRTKVLDVFTSL